eukprot:1141753-Pelagomonas_calceolata.AAC.2
MPEGGVWNRSANQAQLWNLGLETELEQELEKACNRLTGVQNAEKLRKAAMQTNQGEKVKVLTTAEVAVREAEEALNAHRARLTSQHAPASQYGTQRTRQQGGRTAELIAAEQSRESDDEGRGQESGTSGSGSPGGNIGWDEPGDSDESMSSATEGEQGSSEAELDADNGDKVHCIQRGWACFMRLSLHGLAFMYLTFSTKVVMRDLGCTTLVGQ